MKIVPIHSYLILPLFGAKCQKMSKGEPLSEHLHLLVTHKHLFCQAVTQSGELVSQHHQIGLTQDLQCFAYCMRYKLNSKD